METVSTKSKASIKFAPISLELITLKQQGTCHQKKLYVNLPVYISKKAYQRQIFFLTTKCHHYNELEKIEGK